MAITWDTSSSGITPKVGAPSGKIQWDNSSGSTPVKEQSLSDQIWSGLASAGNVANIIFPGTKAIGASLGTVANNAVQGLQGNNPFKNPATSAGGVPIGGINPASQPDIPAAIGGYMQSGAQLAGMGLGGGTGGGLAGSLGRIGTNIGLGSVVGAGNAIENKKSFAGTDNNSISPFAQSTLTGGAIGGAISGVSEGIGALMDKLPSWFAKAALPKLNPDNLDYALKNTSLGTTKSMLENSNASISNYNDQISTILNHPQYKTSIGNNGSDIFDQLVSSFPTSKYSADELVTRMNDYVPGFAKIVDKVSEGTATLLEQNQLRSALDAAGKSVYTSMNRPPEIKAIGQGLADILRSNVQDSAPATKSIFSDFSKEINLNSVLKKMADKNYTKPTWQDITAGYAGYEAGGLKGALTGVLGERLLGSTGGKMLLAKGAQQLGRTAPVANALVQGTKAALVKQAVQ